jgi:hypothetical protein
MSEKTVALTAADLKEILTGVVAEARKPVFTEREQREMQGRQEDRQRGKEQVDEMQAGKEWQQKNCAHRRRDNSPRTIQVSNPPKSGGDFLLCQRCQVIIRHEDGKGKRYENETLFDTDIYNSLIVDQSAVSW